MGLKQSLYEIIPSNDNLDNQIMLKGTQRQYLVAFVGDYNFYEFKI